MFARRIGAAVALLGAAVIPTLIGCSPAACSEAAAFPPGVWLDVSPWLRAHPGATVRACLDSRCVTSAQDSGVLQLVIPNASYPPRNDRYMLTVTSANAAGLHTSTTVRLEETQVQGACGTQTWWSADARLHTDGTVEVWHGEPGPFAPAAPSPAKTTIPTPSATQ